MTDDNESVGLGSYLLTRLEQMGALTIQGVPGDYNMGFLDLVEDHKTLTWVGNCNELNAAYSADGYARTAKRGLMQARSSAHTTRVGAVVTTFGVGELSALNGLAGSFSERVPVVHIVGVPSTVAQGQKALLHHTLGDGRFDAFEEMSRKISVGLVKLEDFMSDLPAAISTLDRALTKGVLEARPVYVSLPTDMVNVKVPSKSLQTSLPYDLKPNEEDAEQSCLDIVLEQIKKAKDPVIIVDACAIRHGVVMETLELVESSGLTVFSTPMGKSAINETHPQFGGVSAVI
jgi:pyruvate decarboxylase